MCFMKKLSFWSAVTHPKHIDHTYCLHLQSSQSVSECQCVKYTENGHYKQNHHLVMKKFSCIAYNSIRRQSYYPNIFYWVAVTHAPAVFNPRCCNGWGWLFIFRRPSICQSSASPRVLRLLSLRCRFVPSKFCFGLQSAWSNYITIYA